MSSEQSSSGPPRDPPRRGPLVVGIVGPPEGTSLLTVALTTSLRGRGYRVGAAESRTTIEGRAATVLTLGSGARVTLEDELAAETLEERVAALDPTLDVLLAPDRRVGTVIELTSDGPATRAPDSPEGPAPLAVVPASRLARAFAETGPAADLGLSEVIAARLASAGDEAERTHLERPIETERRRLPDRPPEEERAPRRSLLDRLRGRNRDRGAR